MDLIKMARELGKEIQKNEMYLNLQKAHKATEEATELQAKLNEFTDLRTQLNQEVMKGEEKNELLIGELDGKLHTLYRDITESKEMMVYNAAKGDLEQTLNFITQIINGAANGEDPETIEPASGGCGGSCSSCSGCH